MVCPKLFRGLPTLVTSHVVLFESLVGAGNGVM
jgi:hypothetical protein